MAPKKGNKGGSMVKWDAKLAELAAGATRTEEHVGAGGNFIKLAGGRMQYKGAEVPGNKMRVVVVDHVIANLDYEEGYDPDNPTAPQCYAFGRDDDSMAPNPKDVPQPINKACTGCPHNEWGSADKGRGKHCQNTRRLALITEGDLEDVASAEVAYLKVSVMSVKGWAGYVRSLADMFKRPPLGVVTEITVVPDPKSQFRLEFKMVETIDDSDLLGQIIDKNAQVAKEIMFPFAIIEQEERPVRGGRNKAKAAARGRKF